MQQNYSYRAQLQTWYIKWTGSWIKDDKSNGTEITEQEYDSLSDDEKRFYQRKLTKQGNYTLQRVASAAGVKNMAEFHNAGYKGLYKVYIMVKPLMIYLKGKN